MVVIAASLLLAGLIGSAAIGNLWYPGAFLSGGNGKDDKDDFPWMLVILPIMILIMIIIIIFIMAFLKKMYRKVK